MRNNESSEESKNFKNFSSEEMIDLILLTKCLEKNKI